VYREKWISCVLNSGLDWRTKGAVMIYVPYVQECGTMAVSDDEIVARANGCPSALWPLVELARATPYLDGSRAVIP
jgi:hypothetical protein